MQENTVRIFINELVRLSNSVKMFLFVVIVLANTFFFVMWIYKISLELREVLIKKWSKVYLCLCLCSNKKILKKIIKEQKVKEINELLREDFFKCNSFF